MKLLGIILGMALVTYIPRMLPAIMLQRLKFPLWMKSWLRSIPYAALGALIFPGIIYVNKQEPLVGILGGLTAAVIAFFDLHIIFVMIGTIAAAVGLDQLLM